MGRPSGPGRLPYPFETLRNWYVSPFGGRSTDLAEGQVGLHRVAVEANTAIDVDRDRVAVGLLGDSREARPLILRERFEVVPLDEHRPDAFALSPNGEVVLSQGEWDFVRRPRLQPQLGQAVVLNKPPGRLAAEPAAILELIAGELRRRRRISDSRQT